MRNSTAAGQSASVQTKSRLLLVDDHPIMRQGLAQLINQEPDLTVCGMADSAAHGFAAAQKLEPDLAVIDISLKGVSGIDLIKNLKGFLPKMPILVLSMHDETLYAERALRAGARGYVMKQEATDKIIGAIRRVLAGNLYVSEVVGARMVGKLVGGSVPGGDNVVDVLSDRELEVLQFIGRGMGTRAIAEEMKISVKTVETYRAHIKEKLRLKDAPELIRFAVDWVNQQDTN